MAIQSIQIFNPDPGKASDLGGLTAAQVFAAPLSRIENLSGAGNNQPFNATESEDFDDSMDQSYGKSQETPSLFAPRGSTEASASQAEDLFRSGATGTTDTPGTAEAASVPGGDLTSFVKSFEGFTPTAKWDAKRYSVGYGTVGRKGQSISRADAEVALGRELQEHRARTLRVLDQYGYKFNDNQKDALTSFAYNVGNIRQLTNNGKRSPQEIADAMLLYNKTEGKKSDGLARRRAAERAMFLGSDKSGESLVGSQNVGTGSSPITRANGLSNESRGRLIERMTLLALKGGGEISATDILQSYYGDSLDSEIGKAQNANTESDLLPPAAYESRIRDRIPVETSNSRSEQFQRFADGNHKVVMPDADARAKTQSVESKAVKIVASHPDSDAAKRYMDQARYNSHARIEDQTEDNPASILEHEIGHHFTGRSPASSGLDAALKDGSLAKQFDVAANPEKTGVRNHMMKLNEATQAMGRFQRETFRATGRRLGAGEFEKMIRSQEKVPPYLSTEGRRIWNYGKQLLEDTKAPGVRKSRDEVIRLISEGMPSLVNNDLNTPKPTRLS